MQPFSSPSLAIELEDLNSVETAFEPSFNDLGLHNPKSGQNVPTCYPFCCCCCAAAGGNDNQQQCGWEIHFVISFCRLSLLRIYREGLVIRKMQSVFSDMLSLLPVQVGVKFPHLSGVAQRVKQTTSGSQLIEKLLFTQHSLTLLGSQECKPCYQSLVIRNLAPYLYK